MFTVEAKDEFGWIDYATVNTEAEAVAIAKEIKDNFAGYVKVIDKTNMIEIAI